MDMTGPLIVPQMKGLLASTERNSIMGLRDCALINLRLGQGYEEYFDAFWPGIPTEVGR
jgi:hypothetical protein